MSELTDAQEKAYAGEIKAILTEYRDEMLAADPPVDPASRITNLGNAILATEAAEATQVKTAAADRDAVELANTLRGNTYKLATSSLSLLEGALGKDHPAVIKARGLRNEMVNRAARGPRDGAPTLAAG